MDLTTLENICMRLKGTQQDIKWGADLCYMVGEKMYCVTGLEPPLKVSLKVTPEDFAELTQRPGIIPAPYLARNHWVLVEDSSAFTMKEWEYYITQSYQLVLAKLSKKLQKEILEK